jgi:hypothetical protein
MLVAAALPIVTVAELTNPVPVIVTGVPPTSGPDDGEMPDTIGAATYVKPPVKVAVPPEVITLTSLAPAVIPFPVIAVIEVSFTITTLVATAPPIVTVTGLAKPVPVMVI